MTRRLPALPTAALATALLLLAAAAAWALPPRPKTPPRDPVVAIAEDWLKVLDLGGYDRSWTLLSSRAKAAVRQRQWRQQMEYVRQPLGRLQKRLLRRSVPTGLPRGSSYGEHVVEFESGFERRAPVLESVTLSTDADGRLRVTEYHTARP